MKYTIKGKQYSEFDINKRCAELMGYELKTDEGYWQGSLYGFVKVIKSNKIGDDFCNYSPCANWNDSGPIIEKCWNELMKNHITYSGWKKWEYIMDKHNCAQLVAACICLIEMVGE